MGDIEADFGDMDEGKTPRSRDDKGKFKPSDKPTEKPSAITENPVEKPVEKPAVKVEEKPADAPTEQKPTRMRELGQAYDDLKKRVKDDLEPKLQRAEAKLKEYESKPPEDTAPILQKLKTLEERNTQLEKHIALVDYEQSQEFTTKYDQPYRDTWNRAASAFSQLSVKESDGVDDLGEPKFKRRPANEADLIKLGSLPLSELDEAAQSMFGASAPRAIQYIEKLRDLATAKQTAIEEAKTKAGEWKSQRTLESQNRQKAQATAWSEINRGLEEKFPKAFKVTEGDADDAASHAKGFALANLKFLGAKALTPEQVEALPPGFRDTIKAGKPLSDVQIVQMDAIVRLKTANHDRLIVARKKDQARIAELEKTLAEYERSEPAANKAGESGRAVDKSFDDTVADELAALDR